MAQLAPATMTQASNAGAVLAKATLRAADLLGLSRTTLARVVGLSASQISRIASGQRSLEIGSKEAELATLLVRAYRALDALVGNDAQHRRLWLSSFNSKLNAAPIDAIQKVDGLVRVVHYLDGARAIV